MSKAKRTALTIFLISFLVFKPVNREAGRIPIVAVLIRLGHNRGSLLVHAPSVCVEFRDKGVFDGQITCIVP